jgi:hypothetical protein
VLKTQICVTRPQCVNVAIVDCSYSFGYHHQAAYQNYKEEIIIHVVSGRDIGLTKVIIFRGISGHL